MDIKYIKIQRSSGHVLTLVVRAVLHPIFIMESLLCYSVPPEKFLIILL